jgi:hypothetical protein
MPLQTFLRAALPFMAGGAVAILISGLRRDVEEPGGTAFPEAWFREADRQPEHLWTGEPSFDWGD